MKFFAPAWLIFCAYIALCKFNQGDTVYGLYYTILAMVTAVSVSRM